MEVKQIYVASAVKESATYRDYVQELHCTVPDVEQNVTDLSCQMSLKT